MHKMLQWKDDYDSVPASNITHIDVSNMAFALNLRRSDSAPPLMSPGKDRIALLERAKQMREKASKEKSGGRHKSGSLQTSEVGQLVKDNGCKSSVCKQVVLDIFNTHEDTQSLRIQMQDIIENLQEDTNILTQLNKEYEELTDVQQTLLKSLSKLDADIDNWQRTMQEKKDEQKEIEAQIMTANDRIRKLKAKKGGSVENDPTVGNEVEEGVEKLGDAHRKTCKKKPSKIHNGHFDLFDGKLQWSCCLAEQENAKGCVDNISVGGMSALAKIKNNFVNQTKVAPLQGSTYRDTSQHHILRYPIMNSLDNLSFDFAEQEYVNHSTSSQPFTINMPLQSSLKNSNNIHQHQRVAIDLPPKAAKRPQTSSGIRSSSPAVDVHGHSTSHFAPFNSFFTSASASSMMMDSSHQKEKRRPQTANMVKSSSTPGFHPQSHNHPHNSNFSSNYNNNLFQVSFADSTVNHTKTRPKSALGTHSHLGHHHSHASSKGNLPMENSRIHSQLPACEKSIYNNSTVIDNRPKIMPENTLLKSFRDHTVGKIRTIPTSESKLPRKNRPMSSPAGYALFRDYQAQVHQPELLPELSNGHNNNLSTTSILQMTGYNSNKDKRYWSATGQGDAFDRPPRKKY